MKHLLFILAALLAPWAAQHAVDASTTKPNILFIFADDWGWGDLSCHGNTMYETPNLDKLAAAGTDFHYFTVDNPVCSPSRAAVVTGQYPARFCIHEHFASVSQNAKRGMPDWLPPDGVTLPRLFQQAGYATAHFGKWHLTNTGCPDAPLPSAYGYDESAVFNGPGPQVNANPNVKQPLSTDKAIDFIRRHKDRPWLVNLWVHATHTPHYPTERWVKKFEHLNERQQVYAAIVAEADQRIGQVLDTLDELGLTNNTLVIFTSDNGPERTGSGKRMDDASTGGGLGTYYSVGHTGGLRGRKRSLYDGGVGVPFIVRWPGHTPAGRVDQASIITAVDMLPTLCAAAGVELPGDYQPDGVNVLPAFHGESFERTKLIFWEWRGAHAGTNWPELGVQDGFWKLLMTKNADRVELYNLAVDRSQSNNLDKQHPERVKHLISEIRQWIATLPTRPTRQGLSSLRKTVR